MCEATSCMAFAVRLELRLAAFADILGLRLAAFPDRLGLRSRLAWCDRCGCRYACSTFSTLPLPVPCRVSSSACTWARRRGCTAGLSTTSSGAWRPTRSSPTCCRCPTLPFCSLVRWYVCTYRSFFGRDDVAPWLSNTCAGIQRVWINEHLREVLCCAVFWRIVVGVGCCVVL